MLNKFKPFTLKAVLEQAIQESQKRLLEAQYHAEFYNGKAEAEKVTQRRLHTQLESYEKNQRIL